MIKFRGVKVRFVILSAILLTILLTSIRLGPMVSAQSYPNITSYRVSDAPNYDAQEMNRSGNNRLDECSLVASVSPGGGHTSEVYIKCAKMDSTFTSAEMGTSGAIFRRSRGLYTAPNGTLVPLSEEATMNVTQLFYNSTYYYQDRALCSGS